MHLSGLKEGGYQFKLTVTDTKGQTDSVEVSVVVIAGWLMWCWLLSRELHTHIRKNHWVIAARACTYDMYVNATDLF